ncbi:hypothetical protein AX16_002619 [Volvariella volvacea WC 439]|nr:hypothetical protein AX16_002619 [Volvariella volvacea WC 439]
MMHDGPYRDSPAASSYNFHDYSEEPFPPAHRFSQSSAQFNSPYASTQDIPLVQPGYNPYAPPAGPLRSMADHPVSQGRSPWLEKQQAAGRRSKWIIVGIMGAVLVLIIIGIAVGVTVANNNRQSARNSSSSGPAVVNQTDPNDPSTFVKDSRLHQSFYGLAYTPEGSLLPDCGNSLDKVITDIQLLSQLTTRIRLYGADCNQSALVLEAIQRTKVNMTVWLGNYVVATDNNAAYKRQRDVIKDAIETYGTDNVGGITVGNEFMLNYLNANDGTVPDSPIGDQGAQILIADIQDTRNMLAGMNLDKTLPVGTSDAGSYFNTHVLEAVDYGMANVHPWFANVSAEQGAGWTAQFFQWNNLDAATQLPNRPTMYIAETGWPTVGHILLQAITEGIDPSIITRDRLMPVTRITEPRPHPKLVFRPSWTLSSVKQIRTGLDTSFSSFLMNLGRMLNSVVLRGGGACSIPTVP